MNMRLPTIYTCVLASYDRYRMSRSVPHRSTLSDADWVCIDFISSVVAPVTQRPYYLRVWFKPAVATADSP